MLVLFSRLLGTATVPLKDLVKDSSHTMQADVNLLDGYTRKMMRMMMMMLTLGQPTQGNRVELMAEKWVEFQQ